MKFYCLENFSFQLISTQLNIHLFLQEVDTGLLKLYAAMDYSSLLVFLNGLDVGCQPKEGVEVLQHYERYHALALFHLKLGEIDQALGVWAK